MALGKAIGEGQGYHSIYAAGAPVHLRYPPGLPLIFALLWTVGRTLSVVAWLAGALSLVATGLAARLIWWMPWCWRIGWRNGPRPAPP